MYGYGKCYDYGSCGSDSECGGEQQYDVLYEYRQCDGNTRRRSYAVYLYLESRRSGYGYGHGSLSG